MQLVAVQCRPVGVCAMMQRCNEHRVDPGAADRVAAAADLRFCHASFLIKGTRISSREQIFRQGNNRCPWVLDPINGSQGRKKRRDSNPEPSQGRVRPASPGCVQEQSSEAEPQTNWRVKPEIPIRNPRFPRAPQTATRPRGYTPWPFGRWGGVPSRKSLVHKSIELSHLTAKGG
jgi:hypothetical protein